MTEPDEAAKARLAREIEHHRQIADRAEIIWNWDNPSGRRRAERRAELFVAQGALRPGRRALELGCGTGIFLEKVARSGATIHGLDLSEDLLAKARTRLAGVANVTLDLGNAEQMPYEAETFDTAYGSSVLHHLDLDAALREVHRVLRPGGRLVFAEPNILNPQVAVMFHLGLTKEYFGVSPDEMAFSRFRARAALERAGFRDIQVTPFDFLHPATPAAWVGAVATLGRWVERVPLLREIGGLVDRGGRPGVRGDPFGRRDVLAALVLLAFAGLLFSDVLFRGLIFFERDVYLHWFGQVETIVRCVGRGSWPLWDPYVGFGQPLLANPSAQILYPWTWLNLLAGPGPVYTAYVVSHFVLSGWGLFVFLRRRNLARTAALAGAGAWMAAGPFLSLVSLWHHLAGAAWIPWVLLTLEAACAEPTVARTLRAGAVLALQVLAGSTDMCAMTGLLAVIVLAPAVDWRRPGGHANRRRLAALFGAVALALGLSAAQWLPSLEVARDSARWKLDEGVRTYWSVHPALLVQTMLPIFVEELPLTPATRAALFEGREPFLSSLYLGLAAVPLLAAAFLCRFREALPFVAAGAGSVLVALGRHAFVYDLALLLLPPLRILRFPSKAMIVVAFCWACLVALGCDVWVKSREGSARMALGAGLLALAVGTAALTALRSGGVSGFGWLSAAEGGAPLSSLLAPVSLALTKGLVAVAGVVLVATLAVLRPQVPAAATAGLAGTLAVLDLWMAGAGVNPVAPPALFAAPPPTLAALAGPGPPRVFAFDYLPGTWSGRLLPDAFLPRPGLSMPVSYSQALGYQLYLVPSIARRFGVFGSYGIDTLGLQPHGLRALCDLARAAEGTPAFARLLRLGAVGYVVALHQQGLEGLVLRATVASPFREPVRVFSVPDALARSYAVGGVRVVSGDAAYRALADPSFDPGREIVLDSGTPQSPPIGPFGSSRLVEHRPDRVRLEAILPAPGYLVLVEAFDPGWHALVDGRPAPVLRANTAFRAVALDAGRHEVELRYWPTAVSLGLTISAITLTAALVLFGLDRSRRDNVAAR